jgi:hypothetical protein
MKAFLSRLFGGGERPAETAPAAPEPVRHQDMTITAQPQAEGSQWRVAGIIARDFGGVTQTRKFIRADLCTSHEEAVEMTVRKGRQIIDQNPRLFEVGEDGSMV